MQKPIALPPFSFAQLRYFLTVAEEGHIGRAAERLHISQPPLSRQIQALETSLGYALFDRLPQGVRLTAAGEHLVIEARTILLVAERASEQVQAAALGLRGRLRLGFTMYSAYGVVPSLVRRLSEAAPDVEIILSEILPDQIAGQLAQGHLDAAITFSGGGGEGCLSHPLARDPLVAAIPADHPLAQGGETPPLSAYAEAPFLVCPRRQAPLLFDSIARYCQSAGFTPRIRLQAFLQQTLISLVAEGLGIAFVPASVSRAHMDGVVYRSLPTPPEIEQVLVWRPEAQSPCLGVFLREIGVSLGGS